jgi:hypothetical protein
MVNSSWPFWSVFDTILGMYLDAADLLWKGADAAVAEDADDIFSLNNNS